MAPRYVLFNIAALAAATVAGCSLNIGGGAKPAELPPAQEAKIRQQFEMAHMACCSARSIEEKMDMYCTAALAGQPEAQEHLGRIYSGTFESPYFKNFKVPENYTLALMWFDKALEHNHPDPAAVNKLRLDTLGHMNGGDIAMSAALKQRWQNVPCGVNAGKNLHMSQLPTAAEKTTR